VRERSRRRRALRFAERSLAVSGLCFLVFHSGFALSEITSSSMAPTLSGTGGGPDNDWVLYETVSTRFNAPPRDKLIVFTSDDGVRIVKRVAGFPGEKLRIHDGRVEVDGLERTLGDDVRYVRAGLLRPREGAPAVCEVPDDALFVLGDDSKNSWDSRFFGGLERNKWRGRVVGVVWPPSRWSWLW
jgi:signal peptidase I